MPLLLSLWLAGAAPDHKTEAKAEAERASVMYRVGKFEDALQTFSHAYEIFQAPGLLFNLGQCHRQLAHHRQAMFFYSEFLREVPSAANREQVEALLEEEKKQQKLAEDPAPKAGPAPPSALAPGLSAHASPSEQPMTKQWWFWTAIGSGVAVVTGGVITAVVLAQPHAVSTTGTLGVLDRQ